MVEDEAVVVEGMAGDVDRNKFAFLVQTFKVAPDVENGWRFGFFDFYGIEIAENGSLRLPFVDLVALSEAD